MVHGLLLNVLMPKAKPEFPSIEGYGLITGNFVITITLCVVVISLVSQSNILKKLLGIKTKIETRKAVTICIRDC